MAVPVPRPDYSNAGPARDPRRRAVRVTAPVLEQRIAAARAESDLLYQEKDDKLTAVTVLDTSLGLVEQTGDTAFTKRAIGVAASTSILARSDGDGRYATLSHTHGGYADIGHMHNPDDVMVDSGTLYGVLADERPETLQQALVIISQYLPTSTP